jgi:hypothetical protein
MARNRTITPDFWTREAVIDCQPMARLLFIGLWNFADDFGVQPLRPRTIRMQVFPGDTIEDHNMRAMIDELAAHGLVRLYAVDGVEYIAIVDWAQCQRVGKRARRRYPACPVAGQSEADQEPPPSTTASDHNKPAQAPEPDEPRLLREKVKDLMRGYWRGHPQVESMDEAVADRWTAKWIAEGCDLADIRPAVRDFYVMYQHGCPPPGFRDLDADVTRYRIQRQRRTAGNVAVTASQSFDRNRHTSFPAPCEMS